MLDPTGELIQHRLFRDSCIQVDADGTSIYVKDLRILKNRSLEDIVIVDNAVISFAYQIDNGIPILPFREDREDVEFLHLIKIMKNISEQTDCRDFVRKAFKIGEIMKTDMDSYVHYYEDAGNDIDLDDVEYLDMLCQAQKDLTCLQKSKSVVPKKRKSKKRASLKKMRKFKSVHEHKVASDLSCMTPNPKLHSQKFILRGEMTPDIQMDTNQLSGVYNFEQNLGFIED